MRLDRDVIKPIPGFPEWLPAQRLRELEFHDTIRESFERFGFAPIETPSVERQEVLCSGGECGSQVFALHRTASEKEGETGLGLHFDLTIPLARYVAQHYGSLVFPFRRYQIQKVWRDEPVRRNRSREFYQCDIDTVGDGSLDLMADAEMPLIMYEIFSDLGVGEFVIRLSNRKILDGFLNHFGVTGERAEKARSGIDRLPKLEGGWPELAERLSSDLLFEPSLLDSLEVLLGTRGHGPELLERIENLVIEDRTYKEGIAELKEVLGYLHTLSLPEEVLDVDFSIARGLGYYTGTVFETFLVGFEKSLGSVCSGGRYDTLMSRFIDRRLPGVGMSIGLTHLFAGLLAARKLVAEKETPAEVMVTVPDRNRIDDALGMANRLRHEGLCVELFVQDTDHDTQLKTAVRKGITIAVIPWPEKIDELDSIEVRNLVNGDREIVLRHEAASVIRFVLEKWRVYGN